MSQRNRSVLPSLPTEQFAMNPHPLWRAVSDLQRLVKLISSDRNQEAVEWIETVHWGRIPLLLAWLQYAGARIGKRWELFDALFFGNCGYHPKEDDVQEKDEEEEEEIGAFDDVEVAFAYEGIAGLEASGPIPSARFQNRFRETLKNYLVTNSSDIVLSSLISSIECARRRFGTHIPNNYCEMYRRIQRLLSISRMVAHRSTDLNDQIHHGGYSLKQLTDWSPNVEPEFSLAFDSLFLCEILLKSEEVTDLEFAVYQGEELADDYWSPLAENLADWLGRTAIEIFKRAKANGELPEGWQPFPDRSPGSLNIPRSPLKSIDELSDWLSRVYFWVIKSPSEWQMSGRLPPSDEVRSQVAQTAVGNCRRFFSQSDNWHTPIDNLPHPVDGLSAEIQIRKLLIWIEQVKPGREAHSISTCDSSATLNVECEPRIPSPNGKLVSYAEIAAAIGLERRSMPELQLPHVRGRFGKKLFGAKDVIQEFLPKYRDREKELRALDDEQTRIN